MKKIPERKEEGQNVDPHQWDQGEKEFQATVYDISKKFKIGKIQK